MKPQSVKGCGPTKTSGHNSIRYARAKIRSEVKQNFIAISLSIDKIGKIEMLQQ